MRDPRGPSTSTYSHRDHRIYREAYRLLAAASFGTVALVIVAYLAPWAMLGALAVLGLAALGGAALWESDMITQQYLEDVRRAGRPGSGSSLLHVEVHSSVGLDRPVFIGARPSPHGRRPRSGNRGESGVPFLSGDRA